jgi:hypothetical protein
VVLTATSIAAPTLRVSVDSFKNGGMMPNKYAFCVPAAQAFRGQKDRAARSPTPSSYMTPTRRQSSAKK